MFPQYLVTLARQLPIKKEKKKQQFPTWPQSHIMLDFCTFIHWVASQISMLTGILHSLFTKFTNSIKFALVQFLCSKYKKVWILPWTRAHNSTSRIKHFKHTWCIYQNLKKYFLSFVPSLLNLATSEFIFWQPWQ